MQGKHIADGRTAAIYEWGDDGKRVLKLFRNGWTHRNAENEFRKAKASQETRFVVPAVYELLEVNGRPGIVYERIEGVSMLAALQSRPWRIAWLARMLANLHLDMHSRTPQGLEEQKLDLQYKVSHAEGLAEVEIAQVLAHLESLAEGDRLLHGDLHPDNVMLTAEGPVIIDWVDASMGHPMADVARTVLLLSMGDLPPTMKLRGLIQWLRQTFTRVYLRTYFAASPYTREEMEAWLLPVLAGRLEEGIVEEEASMLRHVRERLARDSKGSMG